MRTLLIAILLLLAVLPASAQKPAGPLKPGQKPSPPPLPTYEHPQRDPLPIAEEVDRAIDLRLAEAKGIASPLTEDGEFLRRASLDLAGRIPSLAATQNFLDDNDPLKRRKLVDQLLSSPEFGRHLADLWKPLLAPRDPANTKPQLDRFSPWLAEQFNRNRGWDSLARELLGATGDVKDRPETTFLMSHAENAQPKASTLAAATGRVFLGVQIHCAECHDHPFTSWKQADFWGVAAFFGKLRNTGMKGPPWVLTEEADPNPESSKTLGISRPKRLPNGGIVIPTDGGNKGAGLEIPAKVLGGSPVALVESQPSRPAFIDWAVARDNRFFARAFVNRLWAQLFNRGLVHPVDDLREDNFASHPAVLDLLANEFIASEFDIKHLVRCMTLSRAYQRSSLPVPGNPTEASLWARMAVKPIEPEALFDSLMVLQSMPVDKTTKPGAKPISVKPSPPPIPPTIKPAGGKPMAPVNPRDAFVAFFRGAGGAEPGEFAHGIPQFLRRMNGEQFAMSIPLIDRLVEAKTEPEAGIEKLYLATLCRKPRTEEQAMFAKYFASKSTPQEAYAGVLWVLLNSGEFVLSR